MTCLKSIPSAYNLAVNLYMYEFIWNTVKSFSASKHSIFNYFFTNQAIHSLFHSVLMTETLLQQTNKNIH